MKETLLRLSDTIKVRGIGTPAKAKKIKRDNDICLYKRSDDIYEVFKVSVSKAGEIFGTHYPEREVYPSNEQFGKTAWCFVSLEAAENKYKSLL